MSAFLSSFENLHKIYKDMVPYQKESNERYEFFGDSIISHIVCEYLFNRYPTKDEGFLTKLKTN
mgnify:CR=1 FL=1